MLRYLVAKDVAQTGPEGKRLRDRITICAGCRSGPDDAPPGAMLAEDLRRQIGHLADVATTDCMVVCGRPITVSFRATDKAAYLFAGLQPTQADDLASFAKLYAAATDGIVDDVRSCGDLRFCLIGRIPA
jgi:predicted metal-binding protein